MNTQSTLLSQLKKFSQVVVDTGEIDEIEKYTPLDATTNPSLLLKAVQLPQYADIVDTSVRSAKNSPEAQKLRCIIENLSVEFGREILRKIEGKISTEVDARFSFDIEKTLTCARRIIAKYESYKIEKERILIKIASTWEGIQAAALLQKENINCNLTLLFDISQAIACAQKNIYLISPFVGRILDWYKKNNPQISYTSVNDPGVLSVKKIYQHFQEHNYKTLIMGASFRNIDEIIALTGCDKLTISPSLLKELAHKQGNLTEKLIETENTASIKNFSLDEKTFRWLLNESAMATDLLADGIRRFTQDTLELEKLLITRYHLDFD